MEHDERYTIITADAHAGGSHQQYREFLDPKYRDEFDAWRGRYKNPFKDLKDTSLRERNWDGELRDAQQNADGIVARKSSFRTRSLLSSRVSCCLLLRRPLSNTS